jgi:tetratricopeptide (TPR) repeat protein
MRTVWAAIVGVILVGTAALTRAETPSATVAEPASPPIAGPPSPTVAEPPSPAVAGPPSPAVAEPPAPFVPPGEGDARFESLETVWHFEKDGTGWMEKSGSVRVLTAAGRDAFGQIVVPFDADREEAALVYVRTVKPDGTTVVTDLSRAFEQSLMPKNVAESTTLRSKVVPVSNLALGDALEWKSRTRIVRPLLPGGFAASYLSGGNLAIDEERVSLDVPGDIAVSLRYDTDWTYAIDENEGRRVHRWSRKGRPAGRRTGSKPVFIATTFATWETMGAWGAGLFEEATKVRPEIESLAKKLTEGCTTDAQRAEALYRYVATRVRYFSLRFEDHAFRPHEAVQVLHSGYGDCKDKAALLIALCRSSNLRATPVLARLGYDLSEPDVPSPEQFNHAFVAVDLEDRTLWLDPTTGAIPFGATSAALRGRQVLRLDTPGARITRVTDVAGPQQTRIRSEGTVDAAGTLDLKTHVEVRGDLEVLLRLAFQAGGEEGRRSVVQTLVRMLAPGGTIADIRGTDPLDLDHPFGVDFSVRRPGFVSALDKRANVPLPTVAPLFLEEVGAQTRAFLMQFQTEDPDQPAPEPVPYPGMDLQETLSLGLPSSAVELPVPITTETPEASYRSSFAMREGRIEATRTLTIQPSPKQRAALDHVRELATKDAAQTAVLQRPQGDVSSAIAGLSADQLVQMGAASLSRGEFQSAQQALEAAVAKETQHANAWFLLAVAHAQQKHWNEAVKAGKQQVEINPYHKDAWMLLGQVDGELQDWKGAESAFRKRLELDPLDAMSYSYLALTLKNQGKRKEAFTVLENGVRAVHDDPLLLMFYATALEAEGRTAESKQRLDQALAAAKARGIDLTKTNPMPLGNPFAAVKVPMDEAGKGSAETLAEAEAGLRKTVGQLAGLQTPDANYSSLPMMIELAQRLDRTGKMLAQQDRKRARGLLRAAVEISYNPEIAGHLAELEASDGKTDEALRWAAMATHGGRDMAVFPKNLRPLVDLPEADLKKKLLELSYTFITDRTIPTGYFHLPTKVDPETEAMLSGERGRPSLHVRVRVLVSESGKALKAVSDAKDPAIRGVSGADIMKIPFPTLQWDGRAVRTIRTVDIVYHSRHSVNAFYGYGPSPSGEVAVGLRGLSYYLGK